MSDTFSKEKRSQIMSKVRSKETRLELQFRDLLKGLRFRYQPTMIGKPDFAIKKYKIAIFIDSCFWHKCPEHFRQPSTNKKYWVPKINRNVERAKEVNKQLKKDGWTVLRFWEHDVKKNPDRCIKKVKEVWK
jgi:DNA mismatch endonuclease (patch repair protein)